MKKKLELGSQVDINASFDGGADDTSVTYSVPADQQDVISVTSAGVVEALAVGTATVEIKDTSGNLLRAVVFQVLSAADFAMQDDLDTGVAAFTAEFAEVPVAPAFTLVTGGTARSGGHYAGIAEHAFDGVDASVGNPPATYWDSAHTFSGVTASYIGKVFSVPKQIKKIDVQWLTAPTEVDVCISNDLAPEVVIATIPVFYNDVIGNFAAGVVTAYQEIILPPYTAASSIFLRPKTATPVPGTYWANQGSAHIDRFRVWEIKFYE